MSRPAAQPSPRPRSRPKEPSRTGIRRREAERRRRNRLWMWGGGTAAAAVVVVALVVVATRGGSSQSPTSGPAPHVEMVSGGGGDVGQTAPVFTAATVSGSTFRAPGGKPTVVYFMAGWCSTCMPESRALGIVEQRENGRVNILAVDADPTDSLASLQNFIKQVGNPDYAFAQDESGKLVQAFNATALDLTVVMDSGGHVVSRTTTPIDQSAILAALARAGAA